MRSLARRLAKVSLPFAAATFGVSLALASPPHVCINGGQWSRDEPRAPAAVIAYVDSLIDAPFDLRAACALWAGTFSKRHLAAANGRTKSHHLAARLILFPGNGTNLRQLIDWLA